MTIRRLPDTVVNRIAAGEVVERPASAVKELVENAIDAGASRIDVVLRDGGRSLISVTDDGSGMSAGEIALAVERHATSKLPGDDLTHIATLGFRGEALPSIGAVSRLTLASRPMGAHEAYSIAVEGGVKSQPVPAALSRGTRVEVRDLFFATPARLKFLKHPRTETDHAADVVVRLAMAHPGIAFTFAADNREPRRFDAALGDLWDARLARLSAVMGRDFAANSLKIDAAREGYRLTGYIGLPTLNAATAASQYLFVDGRPVRDKLLLGALRAAYRDFLARDRHPMVALFFSAAPGLVDVNVHPAKAEVRFRDSGLVRGLIVGAIKHALAAAGHRAATTGAAVTLSSFRGAAHYAPAPMHGPAHLFEAAAAFQAPLASGGLAAKEIASPPAAAETRTQGRENLPLGQARAQLHETYIVAETADGIVIVDQHAAHERLVHEKLKAQMESGEVPRQALLIPEVVELAEDAAARLSARAQEFASLGLVVESFGAGAVVIREIPAALAGFDIAALVRDLAFELAEEEGAPLSLADRLLHVCATRACHNSVRAGCVLNEAEMNALLRQMEATPHAGQCSHGRPTYIELRLADIEKLFGRR